MLSSKNNVAKDRKNKFVKIRLDKGHFITGRVTGRNVYEDCLYRG